MYLPFISMFLFVEHHCSCFKNHFLAKGNMKKAVRGVIIHISYQSAILGSLHLKLNSFGYDILIGTLVPVIGQIRECLLGVR